MMIPVSLSLCLFESCVNGIVIVCGTIGTQNWIWDLGYEVSGKLWQTYTVNSQTAGFLTQFKKSKLAFLTVHHAGK